VRREQKNRQALCGMFPNRPSQPNTSRSNTPVYWPASFAGSRPADGNLRPAASVPRVNSDAVVSAPSRARQGFFGAQYIRRRGGRGDRRAVGQTTFDRRPRGGGTRTAHRAADREAAPAHRRCRGSQPRHRAMRIEQLIEAEAALRRAQAPVARLRQLIADLD
jgi:hypothetical protein